MGLVMSLLGLATACSGSLYGCFQKLSVLVVGVLITRALLFGVFIRAPNFGKLPYETTGGLSKVN